MPGGLHPPPSVYLTWKPNYIDPESRGWEFPIGVIVLLAITYIVVGLRCWARFGLAKNQGWDDALILLAMIPLTGEAVCLILAYRKYGFSYHVWDLKTPTLVNSRKITIGMEQTYLAATSLTKISILLFFRRLGTGAVSRAFLYTVYSAIAFVVAYFIVFTVNLYVGCRPFHAFWMQVDLRWAAMHKDEFQCFDEAANLVAAAVISVIQDFIACLLPMVLFWKLKINFKRKVALGLVFGVGFILCILGCLRITSTTKIFYDTYDMTWESYNAWLWFAIESHLGVVVASAPALNYFFRHILKDKSIAGTVDKYLKIGKKSSQNDSGASGSNNRSGNSGSGPRSRLSQGVMEGSLTPQQERARELNAIALENFMRDEKHDLYFAEERRASETATDEIAINQPQERRGTDNSWLRIEEDSDGPRRGSNGDWSDNDIEAQVAHHRRYPVAEYYEEPHLVDGKWTPGPRPGSAA